ncbi:MAG: monofunctional biosynthetic peptidoglycan transglycosylase [Elusimicrobiota bacterium]|nr:monofunctional biosynthetic peptidoglycan transglycosylase [Elusimicrobiota bacterium]
MPVLRATLAALLLGLAAAVGWVLWLPDPAPLKKRPPKTTAYIELRKRQAKAAGKPFSLRWDFVPLGAISEHLKSAVVTAEDDGFWRHDGVDWAAQRVAWERNLSERKLAHGGSTITQQLARNLYLSPSRNPLRKVKEALIARRLEKVLGKRRILELYLNCAEWGNGVFGAEAAARAYFGKSAAELTPDEAVAMAVVLPNPRRWSPAKRGRYVERNSRRIIGRMQKSGLWPEALDADDADQAFEELALSTAAAPGYPPDEGAFAP